MSHYSEFAQPQDCVLLLVDIQKSMLDLCINPDEVLRHSAALIEIARVFHIPVLFSTQNRAKLGDVAPELLRLVEKPVVYDKLEFSCFSNSVLAGELERLGRRSLILAGIETHVCIFQTGANAIRLGYRVLLDSQAISCRGPENREAGLNRIEKAGAILCSTEMIAFELLGNAGGREFRELLPLFKRLTAGR